jgi:hypothetical protein
MMIPTDPPITPASTTVGRSVGFKLAALALVLVSGLGGLGLAHFLTCQKTDPVVVPDVLEKADPVIARMPQLFQGWSKPDFVILLSGQQHGYMLPCGCSEPQRGGLERRYNLIKMLEARGWTVVPVDLGDVPQKRGPTPEMPNHQGLIKYRYTMRAMKAMNYAAVGIGEYEAALSFDKVFAEWSLNEDEPRLLCANLLHKFKEPYRSNPPNEKIDRIWNTIVRKANGVNVGIAALVGPTVQLDIKKDDQFSFASGGDVLPGVCTQLDAKKSDFRVLLFQGSADRGMKGHRPEVEELVNKFPQFDVILAHSEGDEPSARAPTTGKSMVVRMGHKARYVGIVGVWKTGKPDNPYRLDYQLVDLSPEFKTPDAEVKGHKVLEIMAEYQRELKANDYLAKYQQVAHPNEIAIVGAGGNAPTYAGSDSCKGCHRDAWDIWIKTPHARAYQTLVTRAPPPSLREFDPECIVCHTIGFGYKSGFQDAVKTPNLINVGCENCHGPASEHIKQEQEAAKGNKALQLQKWRELINPYRTPNGAEAAEARAKRLLRADTFCQGCHDKDNDVHWINEEKEQYPDPFERKWRRIWHYERENPPAEYKKEKGLK